MLCDQSTVIAYFILTFTVIFSAHLFNSSPAVEASRLLENVRLQTNSNSGSILIPPPPLQMREKTREEGEKVVLRGQMGSRPPRCEGRCGSCGHCQAIQVPTTTTAGSSNPFSSPKRPSVAYARGDGYSDYKPMSWKCKCGSSIFNP